MWTDAALFVFFLVLVTIFGSNVHHMTSHAAQILMLFNLGIGTPWGTFWFIACYRNLCLLFLNRLESIILKFIQSNLKVKCGET